MIEKLRRWSHPDFRKQHAKRRLAKLNSDFNWRARTDAKEGRKSTEICHYPEDDLDTSIGKVFCKKLEAEGFTIKVKVGLGGTCHYIKISWGD